MIRLAAVFALVAHPALALSCLPHGITDSWLQASAAPEPYVIVAGRFQPQTGATPFPPADGSATGPDLPQSRDLVTPFEGQRWTGTGFGPVQQGTARLTLDCLAHWCGTLPEGPWIAFLRQDADGQLWTRLGPCDGLVHADTPGNRAAIARCAAGDRCLPLADMMRP